MARRTKVDIDRARRHRECALRLHALPKDNLVSILTASRPSPTCYINKDWQEHGTALINCLCGMPSGEYAIARFVVDLWCLGLKDVTGRLNCTPNQFDNVLANLDRAEIESISIDLDIATELIAGGIRFARDNGFKLPRRYQCWTAMLGDLGNLDTADTSDFGVQGRLRFRGDIEELQTRLVSGRLRKFLERDDVDIATGEYSFSDTHILNTLGHECSAPDQLDSLSEDESGESDEPLSEWDPIENDLDLWRTIQDTANLLADEASTRIRQWCFANRIPPSHRLADAWDIQSEALLQTPSLFSSSDDISSDFVETSHANIERLLSFESPDEQIHLRRGLQQIEAFMAQFDSPQTMMIALGMEEKAEHLSYHC